MPAVMTLPDGRPDTGADLEHLPDDGHRHEIVGEQQWIAAPFPVTVRPADLVG